MEGWRGKGHTLARLGRAREALAAYDEAAKRAPQSAPVWNDRAVQLTVLGRGEEALESLDRALAIEPKSPLYHINRSAALAMLFEDIPGALHAVETAISLAPNQPLGYLAKIQLLRGKGDEEGAKACLEAGLKACPDSPELQAEQMFD